MVNNPAKMREFPCCSECGGDVQLIAKANRTRELRRGVHLAIPEDFEIPSCVSCGEEFMIPEVSRELDAILAAEERRLLESYVDKLRKTCGATQQSIEDALRVTRSYLSHVLSGRKSPSGMLFEMLALFAEVPGAFQHASRVDTLPDTPTIFTMNLDAAFELAHATEALLDKHQRASTMVARLGHTVQHHCGGYAIKGLDLTDDTPHPAPAVRQPVAGYVIRKKDDAHPLAELHANSYS